tara:strand:- start:573 stop:1301 length:729 start_codon:yes stop_codon:yes gene_type:complete
MDEDELTRLKIAQLLGIAPMEKMSEGVMAVMDTPAKRVQDAHRERYLMDMFSGKNPDTGEGFLEPTENEYQKKVSRAILENDLEKSALLEKYTAMSGMNMSNDDISKRQAAILGLGRYGKDMESAYTFDVDGATESYGFSGDGLTSAAMEKMRIMQGIQKQNDSFTSANLGLSGERGFDTPAMRDNAQAVLSRLSEAELRDVMEILPQLNAEQYQAFIAGLENGSINPSGYEVQNQDRLRMY